MDEYPNIILIPTIYSIEGAGNIVTIQCMLLNLSPNDISLPEGEINVSLLETGIEIIEIMTSIVLIEKKRN